MINNAPTFRELVAVFAKIGVLSFGGPAGQIALMHRLIVDEKKWLDGPQYLNALNFCMLLPGPEAMQLATYIGWLTHGVKGGIVSGLLFIMPGAVVLIGLSALYFFAGDVPLVEGLLFGLKAAVVALILEALLRVSKRALKGWQQVVMAIAAFVGILLLQVPFPIIVLIAAILGAVFLTGPAVETRNLAPVSMRYLLPTILIGLMVWFAPLLAIYAFGSPSVFIDLALFFSQAAIVTFGGAYAVLSYVGDVAVSHYQWLEPREMITGLGLAETTPGPLILVLLFVGFLAGARLSMIDPLIGGILGALVTLWFTFVPSFLMIFAGAPFVERVRSMPRLAGALQGVTSSVVGVIASLGLWFAMTLFFPKGFSPLPDMLFHIDIAAMVIALASGLALLRFHIGFGWILASAALAGAAFKLLV